MAVRSRLPRHPDWQDTPPQAVLLAADPGLFVWRAGQVKFHLGIVVPSGSDGAPCAFLTVDGDRRPWHLGKVLIFDDSYKHHVDNHCTALRAVFQVVVVHPAVVAARGQASRRSEL